MSEWICYPSRRHVAKLLSCLYSPVPGWQQFARSLCHNFRMKTRVRPAWAVTGVIRWGRSGPVDPEPQHTGGDMVGLWTLGGASRLVPDAERSDCTLEATECKSLVVSDGGRVWKKGLITVTWYSCLWGSVEASGFLGRVGCSNWRRENKVVMERRLVLQLQVNSHCVHVALLISLHLCAEYSVSRSKMNNLIFSPTLPTATEGESPPDYILNESMSSFSCDERIRVFIRSLPGLCVRHRHLPVIVFLPPPSPLQLTKSKKQKLLFH